MRRIIVFVAAFLMTVGVSLPSVGNAATNSNVVKAKTVFGLDPEGKKVETVKENTLSTISISEAKLTTNSVEIKGNVITKQGVTPFDISGQLFKSSKSDKRVVGKLEDKDGNFRVVHFSIDGEPGTSFFANKGLKSSKDNVVKLYLMNKANRDFTYSEVADPFFLKGTPYEKQINAQNLPVAEHIEEFWYAKILKPFKMESKKMAPNGDVSIQAMKSYEYVKQYSYSYNVLGATVTEYFNVGHYVSTPDAITSQGRWYAKLRVVSEKTVSAEPSLNSTDTNFKIGVYADSYIRAYTEPGDAFDLAGWAAVVSQGGLDFKVSWNKYEWSYGPVGFAVTYNDFKNYTYGYTQNFVNSSTQLTRQAELQYKKGMLLTNPDHYYDAYFDVGHYHTTGTKWLNIRFVYDISNSQDYTYGGVQTDDEYLSYTSG